MGESFRKKIPEVVFPHCVNPVSFLEGGVQADVYTSRGRILVTGFQFHSKIAWPSLVFGKFTIPMPETADLLRLL